MATLSLFAVQTGAGAAPVKERTAPTKLAFTSLLVQQFFSPVPDNALNSEVVSAIAVALAKVGQYDRAITLAGLSGKFQSHPKLSRVAIPVTGLVPAARSRTNSTRVTVLATQSQYPIASDIWDEKSLFFSI